MYKTTRADEIHQKHILNRLASPFKTVFDIVPQSNTDERPKAMIREKIVKICTVTWRNCVPPITLSIINYIIPECKELVAPIYLFESTNLVHNKIKNNDTTMGTSFVNQYTTELHPKEMQTASWSDRMMQDNLASKHRSDDTHTHT